jgi:hypothetical protein
MIFSHLQATPLPDRSGQLIIAESFISKKTTRAQGEFDAKNSFYRLGWYVGV